MKNIKYNIFIAIVILLGITSCNDFLDREPLSQVTPEDYFNNEGQLFAYTVKLYEQIFDSHRRYSAGKVLTDNGTDNQANRSGGGALEWERSIHLVPTSKGNWNFDRIQRINYFFEKVLPKYKEGKIDGAKANIDQAIGEAYFFRAYEYFDKLKDFGDFPIVDKVLSDNKKVLTEASKRQPQNLVARFILEDLDKAINLLGSGAIDNKNRISKEVAQLFKSRVALYEGTWLKYHNGTAFVPGGPNWPGKIEDVKYANNNIEDEIKFFLTQARDAAYEVAKLKEFALTPNNGDGVKNKNIYNNKYYMMFADEDMGKNEYSEVLLWRAYKKGLEFHEVLAYLKSGGSTGYTRGFVQSFLGENGLPIYASGSNYKGDVNLIDVCANRDQRLSLFMVKKGDIIDKKGKFNTEEYPEIIGSNDPTTTGYWVRKSLSDAPGLENSKVPSLGGYLIFRSAEAYLNYIEADYLLKGNLDTEAKNLWEKLRVRAGLIPGTIQNTIDNTNLSKEAPVDAPVGGGKVAGDWAVYSGENMVDKTLYNIRRERRCEFIADGMRADDLRRWRALDKVRNYHIEGFNLWDNMSPQGMFNYYKNKDGETLLSYRPDKKPNVSPPLSKGGSNYLRIYQVQETGNNYFFNGYTWSEAFYYKPVPFGELYLTSPDGDANKSIIYQNPYWPTQAGGQAER